jgi:DNA-binding NarL/FixJ family response regulator
MPIRVLLADDNEHVRKAISRILWSDPEIQLVGEAASFSETMQIYSKMRPHIVVMDLHMKDGENSTALQVRSSMNGSRLLAISIWNDDETKTLADNFGAVTLLEKISLASELIPAIKRHARIHEQENSDRGEVRGAV